MKMFTFIFLSKGTPVYILFHEARKKMLREQCVYYTYLTDFSTQSVRPTLKSYQKFENFYIDK